MFESLSSLFGAKKTNVNSKSVGKPQESDISVRSPEHVDDLEKLVKIGPVTFILVHADWCGPCQSYKPIWSELERSPGRTANMAMIHHDMVEHCPLLKKAKIPGFPSVLKVYPDGKIEEYKMENKKTNSVPNIRDKESMAAELKSIPVDKFLNTVKPKSTSPVSLRPKINIPRAFTPSIKPISQVMTPRVNSPRAPNFSANSRSVKSTPIKYKTLNIGHPVSINTNKPSIRVSASRPPMPQQMMQAPMPQQMMQAPMPQQMMQAPMPQPMPFPPQMARPPFSPVPIMKGGALYTALSSALSKAGPAAILFTASQMLPPKKNTGSNMRLTRKASRSKNSSGKSRKNNRK
jgi:thiol-disulfide isomerase/thioredoxin